MTIKEKKTKLALFIELHVQCGYSIDQYMGKPLSYFDFEKIDQRIEWFKNEYQI